MKWRVNRGEGVNPEEKKTSSSEANRREAEVWIQIYLKQEGEFLYNVIFSVKQEVRSSRARLRIAQAP